MEKTTKKVNKKKEVANTVEANISANLYTIDGNKSGTISLPSNVFGAKWNSDLVSQVMTSQASNRRAGTAHTKDRSEVRGGGKKPWQQKGTGRARHGSSRSPLWRHGGVTFGPRNDKDYKKTIPKSMRTEALYSILSAKFAQGKIIFLESLPVTSSKTKDANSLMTNLTKIEGFKTLTYKKPNNVYMTVDSLKEEAKRSFRNLPFMTIHNKEDLNPLDIANSRYLVIADANETIKFLSSKKEKVSLK